MWISSCKASRSPSLTSFPRFRIYVLSIRSLLGAFPSVNMSSFFIILSRASAPSNLKRFASPTNLRICVDRKIIICGIQHFQYFQQILLLSFCSRRHLSQRSLKFLSSLIFGASWNQELPLRDWVVILVRIASPRQLAGDRWRAMRGEVIRKVSVRRSSRKNGSSLINVIRGSEVLKR
jgi:hypothetical protein